MVKTMGIEDDAVFAACHEYRAPGDDDVHPEPHQVGRELRKPSGVALGPAGLDQDVPVLDPAALPQLFPEALPQANLRRVGGLFPQDADAIHLPRLLRLGGERRGERTGQRGHQKAAAVHYSMTLSARASSDGGIVRPRALAVLRLMTSSYLDACSTGRSAGLAPLRIFAM